MAHYQENIFTKIVRGEMPINKKVYEDDDVLAFYDINPDKRFKHHVLVITKKNYVNFSDMISKQAFEDVAAVFRAIYKILSILEIKNYTLTTNAGAHAEIGHFHVHIRGEKLL